MVDVVVVENFFYGGQFIIGVYSDEFGCYDIFDRIQDVYCFSFFVLMR